MTTRTRSMSSNRQEEIVKLVVALQRIYAAFNHPRAQAVANAKHHPTG